MSDRVHPPFPARTLDLSSRLIGEVLIERGLITSQQRDQILSLQAQHKQRVGEAAVTMGFVLEAELAKFLAEFFSLPYLPLDNADEVDPVAAERIPEPLARRYQVVAVRQEGDKLTLVMADPLDVRALDAVRVAAPGLRIRKAVSSRSGITRALDWAYQAPERLEKSMDSLISEEDQTLQIAADAATAELEHLRHQATDAPVVQFVNLLLMRAIQERASDIHIEPEERSVTVRLRVDGQLREVAAPGLGMLQGIVTRIKILGKLDIAERRLPQDGRFKFNVFGKTIDVRLSSLPTVYGEKLVLRILDRGNLVMELTSLGFEPKMLETFNRVLGLPHGLVIITGPTGSGKTTTLYAALSTIRTPTKNIVTVEDPVEYQLAKINQVHTKPEIGLTFAAGLRSILRQDPDIIMVGEIRDRETADICIRSALTGHLVLSTLHTNDSVSAISRLIDMGVEPYLLTASLSLVMAQRLVRRTCEECAQPWKPSPELLQRLSRITHKDMTNGHAAGWNFLRGAGCKRCGNTGYHGRIAIYEQFVITEAVKALVAENTPLGQIRRQAKQDGLQTLLESALNKVREGVTTLDEAFSVCATQSELFEA